MSTVTTKHQDASDYRAVRKASIGQRLLFLTKDSFLYGGVWALSRVLALFTVPILTRLFSTEAYGAMDAIAVVGSLFVAIMTMGQDSALARFYYETEEIEEKKEIISQSLLMELVICVFVTSLLFLSSEVIVTQVVKAPEYSMEFRLLVASYPFVILFQFFQNLCKWTFARRKFIFLTVGSGMSVLFLTLILVPGVGLGVSGVFLAQLLGMALFGLWGMFICRDLLVLPRHFRYGWEMLHFGWPSMMVAVISAMIPAFDRVLITHFLGLEAMGLYALGFKLAFLMSLPITAFQTAWGPFMLALYKEDNAPETYNKVLVYYTCVISLLGFCFVALAEPVTILIASGRYRDSSVVIFPLVFALMIESIAWIMGIGIDLSKKTYASILSYLIGLASTGLMIWLLIHPLGILGVAIGVLFGRFLMGISYVVFAYHFYPLRFVWKKPFAILLLTILVTASFQFFSDRAPIFQGFFRLTLFAGLSAGIWRGVISERDRSDIISKCRSVFHPT